MFGRDSMIQNDRFKDKLLFSATNAQWNTKPFFLIEKLLKQILLGREVYEVVTLWIGFPKLPSWNRSQAQISETVHLWEQMTKQPPPPLFAIAIFEKITKQPPPPLFQNCLDNCDMSHVTSQDIVHWDDILKINYFLLYLPLKGS